MDSETDSIARAAPRVPPGMLLAALLLTTAAPPALSAPADGVWAEALPAPLRRAQAAAVYDPARGRLLVIGGFDAGYHASVWTLTPAAPARWEPFAAAGEPPGPRSMHTAVYDPPRDRVIVFGGFDGSLLLDEVFALNLGAAPRWERLAPAGEAPGRRAGHTAILDPARDRMVVFGGLGDPVGEAWALDLADAPRWNRLEPAGAAPGERVGHTAILDSPRDRMLVFGGSRGASTLADVWELSLAGAPQWRELAASGAAPGARTRHVAIHDPFRDRMVVFGGWDGVSLRGDVHALRLDALEWAPFVTLGAPPRPRSEHAAVYARDRDELLAFGGSDAGGPLAEVSALALTGTPVWSAVPPTGEQPEPRAYPTAVHDPLRDRMLMFGGSHQILLNDVWELSLSGPPAWTRIQPAGVPPSPRAGHSMIYDPVRDRLVVFGGLSNAGWVDDVWELTLAGAPRWTRLLTAGGAPGGRWKHTAVYEPRGDRMIVFGGYNGAGGAFFLNDLWELSLAGIPVWTRLVVADAPHPREGHSATYDPVRERMLVYGGWGPAGTSGFADLHALSLSGAPAWSRIGATGTSPANRFDHSAVYDVLRDRLVVFGGWSSAIRNDTYALRLGPSVWTRVAPAGAPPRARHLHAAIYDPERDRMIVFGGFDGNESLADVAELALATPGDWSLATPARTAPPGRSAHPAIHDPARDRLVAFGGVGAAGALGDLLELELDRADGWVPLVAAGTPPTARWGHSAIHDPVRDRVIVFGGYDGASRLDDLWALELAGAPRWVRLLPGGAGPSPRAQHAAIHDPVRDRMLVFGGLDDRVVYDTRVWALSLAGTPEWSQLAAGGAPPVGRVMHSAVYDPDGDRLIVFGGLNRGALGDAWALALAGTPEWIPLAPAGSGPSARWGHTAIHDPGRGRMVVFGGHRAPATYHDDVWALTLGEAPAWVPLAPSGAPPRPRLSHAAVHDPRRGRMVVHGGWDGGTYLADVWTLGWQSAVGAPAAAPAAGMALGSSRPNPARGRAAIPFRIGEPGEVTLRIHDVAGRAVRTLARGRIAAGDHVASWDGTDAGGARVPAGVYFSVLRSGGRTLSRRLTIVH